MQPVSIRYLLPLVLALSVPYATGESMTVFTNNGYAQGCYQASLFAAGSGIANDDGIADCNRALEEQLLSPRDRAATYLNRGVLRVAAGDYVSAVADYRRAEELNPQAPEIYLNQANLWFMSGRYEEAIALYDRALHMNMRQLEVLYFNRGMAHEHRGDLQQAMADYQAALALTPEWERVSKRLESLQRKLETAG